MKVVLAGSRKLAYLPSEVKIILKQMLNNRLDILVGDAPGIDVGFQKFLHENKYLEVTVYSSAGYVRNNVGSWNFEEVETGLKSKSNDLHAIKDRKMCSIADSGLMVWDTESAGTLSNVIDLVEQGKECLVFNVQECELIKFDNPTSLRNWYAKYPDVSQEAHRRLARFKKRISKMGTEDDIQGSLF